MTNQARAKPQARKAMPAEPQVPVRIWQLVLVFAVAFGCYAQTAGYQFVWDDNQQIAANDRIRSFANLGVAFQENFWAFLGPNVHGHYYRPLQTVSYMMGYALGGSSPWPYRWLCILYHGLASLMVVWLAWELFYNSRIAFWAGMLFAAHPMHTESVAWSAGITDLGCGIFFFASLAAYLRAQRGGWFWSGISGLSFLSALLFKEMALTIPILAAGLDWVRQKEIHPQSWSSRFRRWLPLVLAFVLYLALRVHALGSLATKANSFVLNLWDRSLTILYLAGLYTAKLIFPVGHNAYRVFRPFSYLSPADWAPPLVLLAVGLALLWGLQRKPLLLFPAAWILIALIPVLSLESVGQNVFAERYLYIPSAGFCMFLPALAEHFGTALSKRSAQIIAWGIVAAYSMLTLARNPVWRDEKTFTLETSAVSPDAAMMHHNLGIVYYKERNFPAALTEFEAARDDSAKAIVPSTRDAYNALVGISTVCFDTGRLEEAWQVASQARSLDVNREEAYFLLGSIRSREGRDVEAEPLLTEAVRLNPGDYEARVNLGSVLLSLEKPAQATDQFQAALKLEPQSVPARLGLAMCHARAGRQQDAIRLLKEALERDPANADALRLLRQIESKSEGERKP